MSDLCMVPDCNTLEPGDYVFDDRLLCYTHFVAITEPLLTREASKGFDPRRPASAPAATAPQVGRSGATVLTPDSRLAKAVR